MRRIALSAEARLLYIDSSALVKLVIEEVESVALARHLEDQPALVTSQIATAEVSRAATMANPGDGIREAVERLLASCALIAVTAPLLRTARRLASAAVRTLDAIHLASALRIEPDELLAYDRRLLAAAAEQGLRVRSPT